MSSAPLGSLLVLSGPSGVGKSTVAGRLREAIGVPRVVTSTTRAPRGGEEHGREYWFLSRPEFEAAIRRGEFLEYAEIHGNLYGTPKAEIQRLLSAGKTVLVDIDTQGARSVREMRLPALFVFIAPPDMEELRRRLEGRKTEDPEAVRRRLSRAEQEMKEKDSYDLVVVNDTVERTVEEILAAARERGLLN